VYELPNPDGRLRIGMALTVYVETAHVEEALVVPVAALVDEDGRAIAFVQVSGETFEKRDLTLGIRDGAFVQILAGLAEGERVVTKGAYAIRLASVSTTIPAHGHAH
jgi:membrane fusion protein, heavy metal efflux system